MSSTADTLAKAIEHSIFAPAATRGDFEKLCSEARDHHVRAVCVYTSRVELAAALLDESSVKVSALIGFPFGGADADIKRYEIETSIDLGANEFEVTINLGRLKDGDHRGVLRELRDFVEAAEERPLKVILETHLLSPEEITLACELVNDSGAQCVAPTSGFLSPENHVDQIKQLREIISKKMEIKAFGPFRDAAHALSLLTAGASRLGVLDPLPLLESLPG